MRVILFGATGMVGQGALRECLLDPGVTEVLVIGRSATRQQHPKLREVIHGDLFDLSSIATRLAGYDACFFCLGVTSAGMSEADYTRVTHDLTLSVARMLAQLNPSMTFLYISGAGTDSSEHGRSMWARVKGRTENDLLRERFKAAYMLRPGYIQPMHGIKSKTPLYRAIYPIVAPLYPVLKVLAPKFVTTTEDLGRAMVTIAKSGAPKSVLEVPDINALVL
ncbi:MAG: NAD(P)H-binding protein [Candidatus Acidiferrum sp.]